MRFACGGRGADVYRTGVWWRVLCACSLSFDGNHCESINRAHVQSIYARNHAKRRFLLVSIVTRACVHKHVNAHPPTQDHHGRRRAVPHGARGRGGGPVPSADGEQARLRIHQHVLLAHPARVCLLCRDSFEWPHGDTNAVQQQNHVPVRAQPRAWHAVMEVSLFLGFCTALCRAWLKS